MTAPDEAYTNLLAAARAGEPVEVRGHACRRGPFACVEFTSTPLVCARRVAWRSALQEFQWFMSGSTRVADLPPAVQPWWAPWGDGAGYGRFPLADAPFSIWDPSGPLPPCSYTGFTALAHRGQLHVTMYQRSCDLVCGAPHDWLQLWAYGLWLAHRHSLPLGLARWLCPDAHVYTTHDDVVADTLRQPHTRPPELVYRPSGPGFLAADFALTGPYCPMSKRKAELIV